MCFDIFTPAVRPFVAGLPAAALFGWRSDCIGMYFFDFLSFCRHKRTKHTVYRNDTVVYGIFQ